MLSLPSCPGCWAKKRQWARYKPRSWLRRKRRLTPRPAARAMLTHCTALRWCGDALGMAVAAEVLREVCALRSPVSVSTGSAARGTAATR
eukprot:4074959-Pleurochrysis_carterae.AAC.2